MAQFSLFVLKEGTISNVQDDAERQRVRELVEKIEDDARRAHKVNRIGTREVMEEHDWNAFAAKRGIKIASTKNGNKLETNGQKP